MTQEPEDAAYKLSGRTRGEANSDSWTGHHFHSTSDTIK